MPAGGTWRPRISANPLITLLSDARRNDVASASKRAMYNTPIARPDTLAGVRHEPPSRPAPLPPRIRLSRKGAGGRGGGARWKLRVRARCGSLPSRDRHLVALYFGAMTMSRNRFPVAHRAGAGIDGGRGPPCPLPIDGAREDRVRRYVRRVIDASVFSLAISWRVPNTRHDGGFIYPCLASGAAFLYLVSLTGDTGPRNLPVISNKPCASVLLLF